MPLSGLGFADHCEHIHRATHCVTTVRHVCRHADGRRAHAAEIAATFDNDDDFEYIELYNISDQRVDLSGARLRGDLDINFPDGAIIEPGTSGVLVANEAAFTLRYGDGIAVLADYGNRLSNDSGTLRLRDFKGDVMREVVYQDSMPWPDDADGTGMSLHLASPSTNPNSALAGSWTASDPTPGQIDGGGATGGGPDYEGWLTDEFSDAQLADETISGPNADPDNDGLPNLAEYVLNGHALESDQLPTAALSADGKALELRFTQLTGTEINVVIELSNDLVSWSLATPADVATVTTNDALGDFAFVVATIQLDTGANYARLKLTRPIP